MPDRFEKKKQFIDAVKNRNLIEAKKWVHSEYFIDIINNCDLEDVNFYIENKWSSSDVTAQQIFNTLLCDGITSNSETISKGLNILIDFYSKEEIEFTDECIIYNITRYPYCVDDILMMLDVNIKCDIKYIAKMSVMEDHLDIKLFDSIIKNNSFEREFYNELLFASLDSIDLDNYFDCNKRMNHIMSTLINDYNCDLNICSDSCEFHHLIQECFYFAPYSIKYLLNKKLNTQALEDLSFWENIFDIIDDSYGYEPYGAALREIKKSPIEFDDTALLAALEDTAIEYLINAYKFN